MSYQLASAPQLVRHQQQQSPQLLWLSEQDREQADHARFVIRPMEAHKRAALTRI